MCCDDIDGTLFHASRAGKTINSKTLPNLTPASPHQGTRQDSSKLYRVPENSCTCKMFLCAAKPPASPHQETRCRPALPCAASWPRWQAESHHPLHPASKGGNNNLRQDDSAGCVVSDAATALRHLNTGHVLPARHWCRWLGLAPDTYMGCKLTNHCGLRPPGGTAPL